jgi:GWxTD domain-containing protein
VPDSLFYEIHYRIIDNSSSIVLDKAFKRVKFDYDQFDTISIPLQSYVNGDYSLVVEVFDLALGLKAKKDCSFRLKEVLPEVLDKKFAWEIRYLVSEKEYKRFQKMDYSQQVEYLKRFWAKRDYKKFEKRLLEADEKFSTSFIKGRDTPMGKYYILNGPPDEIKKYGLEEILTPTKYRDGELERSQELWIYETMGIEVLFKDINNDGVYELINISKIGRQERDDWLKDRRELERFLY